MSTAVGKQKTGYARLFFICNICCPVIKHTGIGDFLHFAHCAHTFRKTRKVKSADNGFCF